MSRYNYGENLGAAVWDALNEPIVEQNSIMEELALARATLQPLVDAYEKALSGDNEKEQMIAAQILRSGIKEICEVAAQAQRIQKDQVITPATVGLLAMQIEAIGQELLGGMPTVLNEFQSRIGTAMVGITLHDEPGEQDVVAPYDMAAAMDATVPEWVEADDLPEEQSEETMSDIDARSESEEGEG